MTYSVVNTYRRQVFENVHQTRKHTLFNLTDCLLANTEAIINPAYLSLNSGYSYTSFYTALNTGVIDQQQLLYINLNATTEANFPKIFAIDTTNIVKPRARTSHERVLLHQSGHTKYSHQTAAGWKVQYLVQITGERTSWAVPLHAHMLAPFENPTWVAFTQIKLLCENITLTAGEKITMLLDAGFNAPTLTHWVREHNLPVVLIVRLANNLVFYTDPTHDLKNTTQGLELETFRDTLRKRGRKTIHGNRLTIKNPQLPACASVCTPLEKFGNVNVQAWENVHSKLTGEKLAAVGAKPVPGTVVTVQAQHFTRSGSKGTLHVWVSEMNNVKSLPLFEILFTYLQRYSIEHLFRFLKHSFGMTNYHAKDKPSFLNWLNIQIIAYTQLVLVKTMIKPKVLPWDSKKRANVTPFKIWQGFKSSLRSLWYPAVNPKNYKPGPGKPPGSKQKKRKRYRIVRKWHPEAQNRQIRPPPTPTPV